MSKFIALLKREILEHKNIWRLPLVLLGIGLLVKMSLSIGNLAIDIDVPEQLQLDGAIDSALDGVIARALNSMNYLVTMVMFVVAVFYALACLYDERQDNSVLFWRSMPVSDSMTIASKLCVALLIVPLLVIVTQALLAILFFGAQSFDYLSTYYSGSLLLLGQMLLWSMLPTIAWCMFCSEVSAKSPFLLAFVTPVILILLDKLFFDGYISQTFVINRFWGVSNYTFAPLISGLIFSAVCLAGAVSKRSQRV
ncbi:MAG: hypothetical protein HKN50_04420 [Gammaproteobacteria bacterium]|nr:hypothetical protein [Gammaproteobacteria bacterium]